MFQDFFEYAKADTIKQYLKHKGIDLSHIPWLGGFGNAKALLRETIYSIKDCNLRNTVIAELNDICAMTCDRGQDNLLKRISDPQISRLYGRPYDLAAIVFIYHNDVFIKAKKATGLAMPVYCLNKLLDNSSHLSIDWTIDLYKAKVCRIYYQSYDGTKNCLARRRY